MEEQGAPLAKGQLAQFIKDHDVHAYQQHGDTPGLAGQLLTSETTTAGGVAKGLAPLARGTFSIAARFVNVVALTLFQCTLRSLLQPLRYPRLT